VRRKQQQSAKGTWEGDGLRWADSNTNVVPSRLLNPFPSNRCQIRTDFHSYDFSVGPDGLNKERETAACSTPDIEDSAPRL
jgi:hypothetical protein